LDQTESRLLLVNPAGIGAENIGCFTEQVQSCVFQLCHLVQLKWSAAALNANYLCFILVFVFNRTRTDVDMGESRL